MFATGVLSIPGAMYDLGTFLEISLFFDSQYTYHSQEHWVEHYQS